MLPLIVVGVALYLIYVSHQVLVGFGVLVVGMIVAALLASREGDEPASTGNDGNYRDNPRIAITQDEYLEQISNKDHLQRGVTELNERMEQARQNNPYKNIPPAPPRKKVRIKIRDIYTDYDA